MINFKNVLIQSALLAGKYQLQNFDKLKNRQIHHKKYGEYVTYVDKISEKIIIRHIKKYFPDHNFISEESKKQMNNSDYTWYIDPLDGTTNYSIKNPIFAVSITIAYKKEVVEGVIFMPYLKQLFYVKKGQGAYLNNKKIHVSKQNKIHKSILMLGFAHRLSAMREGLNIFREIRPYVANVRIFGSACFSLSSVAAGHTEAILMPGTLKLWDINPGILLVKEAGGKVTDFRGNQNFKNQNLILSNGKIHQQIVKRLK